MLARRQVDALEVKALELQRRGNGHARVRWRDRVQCERRRHRAQAYSQPQRRGRSPASCQSCCSPENERSRRPTRRPARPADRCCSCAACCVWLLAQLGVDLSDDALEEVTQVVLGAGLQVGDLDGLLAGLHVAPARAAFLGRAARPRLVKRSVQSFGASALSGSVTDPCADLHGAPVELSSLVGHDRSLPAHPRLDTSHSRAPALDRTTSRVTSRRGVRQRTPTGVLRRHAHASPHNQTPAGTCHGRLRPRAAEAGTGCTDARSCATTAAGATTAGSAPGPQPAAAGPGSAFAAAGAAAEDLVRGLADQVRLA